MVVKVEKMRFIFIFIVAILSVFGDAASDSALIQEFSEQMDAAEKILKSNEELLYKELDRRGAAKLSPVSMKEYKSLTLDSKIVVLRSMAAALAFEELREKYRQELEEQSGKINRRVISKRDEYELHGTPNKVELAWLDAGQLNDCYVSDKCLLTADLEDWSVTVMTWGSMELSSSPIIQEAQAHLAFVKENAATDKRERKTITLSAPANKYRSVNDSIVERVSFDLLIFDCVTTRSMYRAREQEIIDGRYSDFASPPPDDYCPGIHYAIESSARLTE
ncbi:MAG: hypothetical protein LBT45_01855 [Rickettsiales bacterium]|jgi:hypothetical protein|nr:hypothetical protein [Rickettsiales bacterium]